MHAFSWIGRTVLGQQGYLFAWVPVCLGLGIGAYFSLTEEPPVWVLLLLAALALGLAVLAWRAGAVAKPLLWAAALIAAGVALAGARAHLVQAPVIGWRFYGPVEGRIVGIDRSASDAVRLTLDELRLGGVAPARTPARLRVSLHGAQGFFQPEPGQRVQMTALISPPQGPVEPGGFDFRRHAWFQRLGGAGYTRSPALLMDPPAPGWSAFGLRMRIARHIQAQLPGETGGFAAAVTTGDRSGISQTTLQALRDSNLAHLLAISGLHMGLLVGVVFAALRSGLALVPALAMRLPAKRLVAALSIGAALIYLVLSGGNVATQRAFVMAAVALAAVMADRRVISLRAVATAAIIVLVAAPESLLSPGFHMSFAATVALVAVFGMIEQRGWRRGPRWLWPVLAVVLSSLVAGLATAPYGAAHFNRVAYYGLAANLLAVPVMGALVIPAAVLAACLAPLGLEGIGLWLMGLGLDWILGVADQVAALDGATGAVITPAPWVLPLFSLGGLLVILWQGRLRWLGLMPAVLALASWGFAPRPTVLVADTGGLVGVMTGVGRALSRAKTQGFIARNWLDHDGDAAAQAAAAGRWPGDDNPEGLRMTQIAGQKLIHVQGKRGARALTGCAPSDMVIASVALEGDWPCEVYDPARLAATGALAIMIDADKLRILTAEQVSGRRLWSRPAARDQ